MYICPLKGLGWKYSIFLLSHEKTKASNSLVYFSMFSNSPTPCVAHRPKPFHSYKDVHHLDHEHIDMVYARLAHSKLKCPSSLQ